MIMIMIFWSRISLESFSPLKPFAYAPPQESFYWIDDGALIRGSMKLPPKKGSERAPPEATWGAQGHLVWEDGQGQQAQSKVQHQHDKVFAQGYLSTYPSSTSTLLGRKRISTGWSQSLPVWRQTYTHRWINPCFNKYLQQPNFNNYLQQQKKLSLFQGISIHTANTQNQADPYVCLRLVPNSRFWNWKQLSAGNWDLFVVRFSDTPKHRTQTQRRTLFPLFDETFDLWVESFYFQLHFHAISFQLCVWGSQKERKCLPADSGQGSWAYGPGLNNWRSDWNWTMVWTFLGLVGKKIMLDK